jgi:threonine/homoserine/homoserine lactone efflux protein
MKILKNIFVGFLVSFVGSVPPGYLNIVGFQIYQKSGISDVLFFLTGIIVIEMIVIYSTLLFAKRLSENLKLLKIIDIFSIFFMLLLAFLFYSQSNNSFSKKDYLSEFIAYSPFVIGILLNSLNFIQLPFWTSWNLYLINNKYITVEKNLKIYYVLGTLIGTFFGMLTLILGLNELTANSETLSTLMLSTIIPLFFVGMAIFQIYKYQKKYSNSKI